MNNNPAQLKKGPILPVYLLFGTESYYMMQYRDILINRLGVPKDDMNFTRYTRETYSTEECLGTASTLPFFAERRVVLVQKADAFSRPDKDLADYLKDPPETTCLIFVEEKVSKKLGTFKAIDKIGGVFEFSLPSQRQLESWILRRIASEEKKITKEAFSEFWMRTNGTMAHMSQELDKLLAYCRSDTDITIHQVRAICSGSSEIGIFDMTDAIAAKDRPRAIRLCGDLLEQKEPPVRIISMVTRQLNQLLTVKEMTEQRARDQEIAAKLHVPLFILQKKIHPMAKNFSAEELKSLLSLAADLDFGIKSGHMDGELAVMKLIYSGTAEHTTF